MKEVLTRTFHHIEKLSHEEGQRDRLFILDAWRPERDVWLTGCAIGLLCSKSDNMELYLAVSRSDELRAEERYFLGLKQDWMFYQQRDVYAASTGINDLVNYHFLPEGQGFLVRQGDPVYIKVGALNLDTKPRAFDAMCTLYYLQAA